MTEQKRKARYERGTIICTAEGCEQMAAFCGINGAFCPDHWRMAGEVASSLEDIKLNRPCLQVEGKGRTEVFSVTFEPTIIERQPFSSWVRKMWEGE